MAYSGHSQAGNSEAASPRERRQVRPCVWMLSTGMVLASLLLAAIGAALPRAQEPQANAIAPEPVRIERGGARRQDAGDASSSSSQSPVATASSWSMAPTAEEPPANVAAAAAAIAGEAERRYGIRIALEGQDWGADEAAQKRNIGAVMSAVERLPDTIISAAVTGPREPLTVLSNAHGRTLSGWQPYGDIAKSFYTNSGQSGAGQRPANQIVLAPGAEVSTVVHELLHAYQFRTTEPGEYVLALLADEMQSFMAATGWRRTVSETELRAAAHRPWETVDGLFVYEGRPLEYRDASGSLVFLDPPNPVEAFAMAGALYYARPDGTPLPDWPEHWQWFRANTGPPPKLSTST